MASTIPIGFENIGNTCFANAVLQCLLHTPEMLMFLSSLEKENCFDQCNKKISKIFQKPAINRLPKKIEESKSYFEDENTNFRAHRGCKLISSRSTYPEYCCAYCGVKNIAEEINNSNKICVPHGLRDILKKTFGDHIKFGLQQDAHEFLIMLLHNMQSSNCAKDKLTTQRHNDDFEMNFNKMTLNIKLSDIFEGSFNSSVTCLKCNYSTKIKQDFLDISLDVKSSFEESMKDFFSDCKFEGNNQYDCHNCRKHTNAIKKITLEKEPHNLIINIKKYDKFGLKIKSSDAAVTNFKYVQKFNLNDYISHSLQKSHSTKKDSIYQYTH